MIKQLGELTIRKSADYNDTVINALEKAGFVIVLSLETFTEKIYIVAKDGDEEWGC